MGLRRAFGEKHALSKQGGGTQPRMASPQVPLQEATRGIHLATLLPVPEPAAGPLRQSVWSVSVWITLWAREETCDPKDGPQRISLEVVYPFF